MRNGVAYIDYMRTPYETGFNHLKTNPETFLINSAADQLM